MRKTLDRTALETALRTLGLNQARVAEKLGVSRETVSKWIKGTAFPRPDRLLRLGMMLGLRFSELVAVEDDLRPVPSFRFKGSVEERPEDYRRARHVGELLERLVPYLPERRFENLPTLRNPSCDTAYLEGVCKTLRKEMGFTEDEPITLAPLLGKARRLGIVLIPVLWGGRDVRQNALRIYLPASQTTWIFLDLDSSGCDFLFWFIHELGHVYAPSLPVPEAERFSDLLARHLLCPPRRIQALYEDSPDSGSRIAHAHRIIEEADSLRISPVAVLKALDDYADLHHLHRILHSFDPRPLFQGHLRRQPTVAEAYLGKGGIRAADYLRRSQEVFGSEFFQAMSALKRRETVSPSFFQEITQMSLLDSRTIWEAL